MPNNLEIAGPYSPDIVRWLARVYALVQSMSNVADTVDLRIAIDKATRHSGMQLDIAERHSAVTQIVGILHRALAVAELDAPLPTKGAFIPVGNAFEVFSAIERIFSRSLRDMFVIDPWMDEKTLIDYLPVVPEGVQIRLLSDEKGAKSSLLPAVKHWQSQFGQRRPLLARLAPARTLHDRAVIADDQHAWILSQSLKDFAVRSPGTIIRADDEVAQLKIAAYTDLWDQAKPIE